MDATIRLALELPVPPPLPGTAREVGGTWLATLAAACRAASDGGFDALYLRSADVTLDPCTLAGALGTLAPSLMVGVVQDAGTGRLPAVLARDITTLDVVTEGRASLLLRAQGPGAPRPHAGGNRLGGPAQEGPSGADRVLIEEAQICRAMFREEAPTFAGSCYQVERAVNRPAPVRPGGPFVVLDPAGAVVGPDLARSVDAVVVRSSGRTLVRHAAALRGAWRDAGVSPAPLVWWGGSPGSGPAGASGSPGSPRADAPSAPVGGDPAAWVALAAAGLDGVLVACRAAGPSADEIARLGAALRGAFAKAAP